MYQEKFWINKNKEYLIKYGVNQPNLFAELVVKYFIPAGSVLDLAAGIGQDSLYFAQQGFNVTTTEYSEEYFKDVSREVREQELRINFQSLDLLKNLPFVDNSFDAVYAHMGLHYFNNKDTRELFKEIYRVIKKDGIFASIFNTIDDPEIELFKDSKIEENLYLSSQGVSKCFFSVNYLQNISSKLFTPIILDNKGETYKDGKDANLIRFIGKKL